MLHLLSSLGEQDLIIDEVWSCDAVNHGDSALLNREKLCSLCNSLTTHWGTLMLKRVFRRLVGQRPGHPQLLAELPPRLRWVPFDPADAPTASVQESIRKPCEVRVLSPDTSWYWSLFWRSFVVRKSKVITAPARCSLYAF